MIWVKYREKWNSGLTPYEWTWYPDNFDKFEIELDFKGRYESNPYNYFDGFYGYDWEIASPPREAVERFKNEAVKNINRYGNILHMMLEYLDKMEK